tara:strand:- start:891 stop:1160 length:270 start_codon:yes stop_codon:yes gene_type:complete
MSVIRKYKSFDDTLLDIYPELRGSLKPNDKYPELKHVTKTRSFNLPNGSLNTRVVINDGEIIERVYRTPKGQVVSLLSNSSKVLINKVA